MNSTNTQLLAELRSQPFCLDLSDSELAAVAACGSAVDLADGEHLLTLGGPCDWFWIIVDGEVDVSMHGPPLGMTIIGRLHTGDVAGVSWVAEPFRSEFDLTAVGPGRAVRFDASDIRRACVDDPELGNKIYLRMATLLRDRLHATRLQLLDLYGGSRAL
jgi:CRP/FNR family transcriptional regulator, cyclic AMP receptor protein